MALLLVAEAAPAQPERCAATFADAAGLLGRLQIARTWREVTMSDGKPLTLQIQGDGSGLRMSFVKEREGLWAQGAVQVCRRAARVLASISASDLTLGPAAGWPMRQLLSAGATLELAIQGNGNLRVSAPGWSGDFEAVD